MDSRFMLVCELLTVCPSDLYPDYCRIADAIEGGESREDILDMPEVRRWPDTFDWLKERL